MSSAVGARARGVLTALDYQEQETERRAALRAVRAVRHRVANTLQVASGWAQLGEGEKAQEVLARMVREEALLSALGRAGDEAEQYALWQLLADAEEAGQPLAWRGEPGDIGPRTLQGLLPQLRRALADRRAGVLLIACAADGVTVSWPEEDLDVRR